MSTMTVNQLAFPDLAGSLHDANGMPVNPATVSNQAFTSSDPSVTIENRAPDGTPDANGSPAAVAQTVGVSTITFTGTNLDGSTVTLTDTMTITEVPAGPAVDGPLLFGPPMTKPPVVTGAGRRR